MLTRFFTQASTLTDGSEVYDVMVESDNGTITIFAAENMRRANDLAASLNQSMDAFGYPR